MWYKHNDDAKKHKCDCGIELIGSENIKRHKQNCEIAIRNGYNVVKYECEKCGKIFKQQGNLDIHNLKEHGIYRSTRNQRSKLRKEISEQYSRYEVSSKEKSYSVLDSITGKQIRQFRSEKTARKFYDNMKTVYGLYACDENTSFKLHWNDLESALHSLIEDRKKQEEEIRECIRICYNTINEI